MIKVTPLKTSGSNTHCLLIADSERELERMARRLHEEIHGKGSQAKHLDLNPKKRQKALQLGAVEQEGEWAR